MQGMILQTAVENKDIKFSTKKGVDTKSEDSGNIFENLIAKLVSQEGENENANFLLGKLLNISSDFTNKGKIISEFSKGDILSDDKGEEILLEDLFSLALSLKNDLPIEAEKSLPKSLKIALKDKDIVAEFKGAKNIKELLSVADKHDIKVKNFQFFISERALDPKDKKMVQKITSEDIFKMSETKTAPQEKQSAQNILSKIINQEVQNKQTTKHAPETTLASLLNKDVKKSQNKPTATETKKVEKNPTLTAEVTKHKPIMTETKVEKNIDKNITAETINVEAEQETIKQVKPQKSTQNRLASLPNYETPSKEPKPVQQAALKEEPVMKTEAENKEPIGEKHIQTNEVKTESVHKHKETADVKKTMHTFVTEFKEKVESYKPPLMKVNMQLSPKNLGDVDVTLITRGNNLHVNINANSNNTLALFVQNQAEFKNSLVNMGFSDLQMNFGDGRGEQRGQNHKKEDNEQADYHDSLENEELEGINMILPNYV